MILLLECWLSSLKILKDQWKDGNTFRVLFLYFYFSLNVFLSHIVSCSIGARGRNIHQSKFWYRTPLNFQLGEYCFNFYWLWTFGSSHLWSSSCLMKFMSSLLFDTSKFLPYLVCQVFHREEWSCESLIIETYHSYPKLVEAGRWSISIWRSNLLYTPLILVRGVWFYNAFHFFLSS